jgi:hypothetical protein
MEGRLISQHSLRQHASCDYAAQFPIERLTSPKERVKEVYSTITYSAFLGVYQSTIESILLLMGQATLGQYFQTHLLSLPMLSTCCAIMHGVMILTCFLYKYSMTMTWLTLGPRCSCGTLIASCTEVTTLVIQTPVNSHTIAQQPESSLLWWSNAV